MSAMKKILPIFMAAAMSMSLFGCGGEDSSSTSDSSNSDSSSAAENDSDKDSDSNSEADENSDNSSDTEEATVQADIPLEYDGTDVNDNCADTINKYFTAIINQKYDDYKATLDPYYFQVYNSWLYGNYGYGMETSFESMHQTIMDAAATANSGEDVKEVRITKLKLNSKVDSDDEEGGSAVEEYLAQYNSLIDESFSEELKKHCDDVIDVTFTMTADCDGQELEILREMELLMTVSGDEYRILG